MLPLGSAFFAAASASDFASRQEADEVHFIKCRRAGERDSIRFRSRFIKVAKNSLNNRFVPWDRIRTEAVLSLDDDIDLKQHEIVFAFR